MKITKKLIKDYLARLPRAVVHHGIDGDVDRQTHDWYDPFTGLSVFADVTVVKNVKVKGYSDYQWEEPWVIDYQVHVNNISADFDRVDENGKSLYFKNVPKEYFGIFEQYIKHNVHPYEC